MGTNYKKYLDSLLSEDDGDPLITKTDTYQKPYTDKGELDSTQKKKNMKGMLSQYNFKNENSIKGLLSTLIGFDTKNEDTKEILNVLTTMTLTALNLIEVDANGKPIDPQNDEGLKIMSSTFGTNIDNPIPLILSIAPILNNTGTEIPNSVINSIKVFAQNINKYLTDIKDKYPDDPLRVKNTLKSINSLNFDRIAEIIGSGSATAVKDAKKQMWHLVNSLFQGDVDTGSKTISGTRNVDAPVDLDIDLPTNVSDALNADKWLGKLVSTYNTNKKKAQQSGGNLTVGGHKEEDAIVMDWLEELKNKYADHNEDPAMYWDEIKSYWMDNKENVLDMYRRKYGDDVIDELEDKIDSIEAELLALDTPTQNQVTNIIHKNTAMSNTSVNLQSMADAIASATLLNTMRKAFDPIAINNIKKYGGIDADILDLLSKISMELKKLLTNKVYDTKLLDKYDLVGKTLSALQGPLLDAIEEITGVRGENKAPSKVVGEGEEAIPAMRQRDSQIIRSIFSDFTSYDNMFKTGYAAPVPEHLMKQFLKILSIHSRGLICAEGPALSKYIANNYGDGMGEYFQMLQKSCLEPDDDKSFPSSVVTKPNDAMRKPTRESFYDKMMTYINGQ